MEKKVKLLLAEDDENLGLLLKEYLIAKGYETDLYPDGEAAYKGFTKHQPYSLCILDIMMPKKDGISLAKDIRLLNMDVPIIFLTAKNMKEDVLEGFKIGADDYITKPFSMEELIFRIEAVEKGRGKKYILLNAPNDKLEQIIKVLPGMTSPTIMPLAKSGWSSLHSVINESEFWEVIGNLKKNGAEGILVIPIEKWVDSAH